MYSETRARSSVTCGSSTTAVRDGRTAGSGRLPAALVSDASPRAVPSPGPRRPACSPVRPRRPGAAGPAATTHSPGARTVVFGRAHSIVTGVRAGGAVAFAAFHLDQVAAPQRRAEPVERLGVRGVLRRRDRAARPRRDRTHLVVSSGRASGPPGRPVTRWTTTRARAADARTADTSSPETSVVGGVVRPLCLPEDHDRLEARQSGQAVDDSAQGPNRRASRRAVGALRGEFLLDAPPVARRLALELEACLLVRIPAARGHALVVRVGTGCGKACAAGCALLTARPRIRATAV